MTTTTTTMMTTTITTIRAVRLLACLLVLSAATRGCARRGAEPGAAAPPGSGAATASSAPATADTVPAAAAGALAGGAASPGAAPTSPAPEEIPLAGGAAGGRGGPFAGFTEVTREAGINFRHQKGVFDRKVANIMPWVASIGAAAAVSDYDRDGDLDLYVTSSRQGCANALLRNEGGLRFRDVARLAGVAEVNDGAGVSMDAAFADLDNDGDDDLYVVSWGRDRLFQNQGDGTFVDITAASGTGDPSNGNCVLPFDYDNDGLLDLLVCNYFPSVDLQNLENTRIMHDSFEAARNGGPDVLYRNLGGLRFENVAHSLQLDDTGWSLDAGISDIDNDGDLDLYLANDFGQDKLFLGNGRGAFTDVTPQAIGHEGFKGMNIDFGDFNNDGFTDGYVSNITTAEYLKEGNMLLLNAGDGTFSNVAAATGTFDGGWGWCARFFDYDADGFLDLLEVNGFVSAGPESYWEELATIAVNPAFEPADASQWPAMGNRSLSGNEPARLFHNRGDGSFDEVAARHGIANRADGRGIALGDFDNDGDLDVYLANQDAPGALYRNDIAGTGHFLVLSLTGTRSNRNAIGARVQVTAAAGGAAGPLRLTREVNGVNGYASQSTYRLHFGLAQAERVERLTVFWPSGIVQDFGPLPADRHYRIVEAGEPWSEEARRELYFSRARQGLPLAAAGAPAGAPPGEGTTAAPSPALLLELEEALRRKPRNVALASRYRIACVDGRSFDRSIEFFRRLVREHPDHREVRLDLALAFIDKIPFQKDALLQASLAKESLNELKFVEERFPDLYAVHYLRGMNHLYWPAALKDFDDRFHHEIAIEHFQRCLGLQKERAAAAGNEPHYAEVHCGLGDAFVKAKRFAEARRAWQEGLEAFPSQAELQARLAKSDDELSALVREERGLQKRIDTRLEWLVRENGLARAEEAIRRAAPGAGEGERATVNAYRLEAFELDETPRALGFLERMAAERPGSAELRLHLALALADRISAIGLPNPETLRLGERVLAELRAYQELASADWLGPYLEGICHLYRPQTEATVAAAVAALRRAVELSRRADGAARVAYPDVALGDAVALAGDGARAVELWRETARIFPKARGLKARLEANPAALGEFVRSQYRLARGIPTDLTLLADREAALAALERNLREKPAAAAADAYRREARAGDDPERAVRFLRGLLAERPRSAALRVQLALALIDRSPDDDLGSVRKGLLSSEALTLLEEVKSAYPESLGVEYTIGLVHLNWFTKLKHVPFAVKSFERCLELMRGRERERPANVLVYQALGDAWVKAVDFPRGRNFWKEGLQFFPGDRGLIERIGLTSFMVNRYVEEARSWDAPQDTWQLSALIGEPEDFPEPGAGG